MRSGVVLSSMGIAGIGAERQFYAPGSPLPSVRLGYAGLADIGPVAGAFSFGPSEQMAVDNLLG